MLAANLNGGHRGATKEHRKYMDARLLIKLGPLLKGSLVLTQGLRYAQVRCHARLELHVALRHDVIVSAVQATQACTKNRVVRHDFNWTVVWLCPGWRASNWVVVS